ncbi:Phosphatidylinositol-4-phosphate 5-kinase [Pichia californica]|uniref:Phosphatidylinositol-4-phosphate 5-kinase n=1 Tax=Pichia californica TaxID=460514 RepID=A0A9P6WMH8_9ASCO|nr:Phosphatidylinositol-4-phosphate 5-kinase [[Candida] californica]KAG0689669.1 Phosphatidylinositol-4-phosphate 5-kinase [[Candida] californica]
MIKSSKTEAHLSSIILDTSPGKNIIHPVSPNKQQQLHHHQKSSVTVSKSSSEGGSTFEGIDTSVTSMEDSKNSSPINRLNLKLTNTHTTESVPLNLESSPLLNSHLSSTQYEENSALTTSVKTEVIETGSMLHSINNQNNLNKDITNDTILNNSSVNRLSNNDVNFKVNIPLVDSTIHITEDLSSAKSSSDDDISSHVHSNHHNYHNEMLYTHPTHSYRVLADPTGLTGQESVNLNNNDSLYTKRLSNIDPLSVIDNDDDKSPLIPLPNSEPNTTVTTSKHDVENQKSNTYPRSSTELNALKFRNNKKNSSNLPLSNSSNKNHSDRKTFQSINTIKIPDNYQKTELAITSGSHKHSSFNGEIPKYRVPRSTSFMNTTRKSRMKADDSYNIPGQNISENHENYAIVYDLVTGIRFSVSRCSKNPVSVNDASFENVTKLIFNRQGNAQAPPTKYEFKFKDYAPEVFRDLRRIFNVNQADYLMSLNDEIGVRAVGSSGKSGSSFYYSNDRKFIIKTIHRSEHKHLRRILKDYYHYVKNNPNTLLCQFYGLHRLKMTTRTGTVKVHVLVMNNLLPPLVNISDSYDLKGSTYGRKTTEKKRLEGSCMKDLNFIENKVEIHLSNSKREEVENQLKNDVGLLKRLNIMDYSLLLGLRYLNQSDEQLLDDKSKINSVIQGTHKNTIFDTDGGIRAIDTNGEVMDMVYYIGIIDCLTNYNTLKKLETFFRSLRHKRETISAIPPHEYGNRFLDFIFNHIKSPGDDSVSKKKVLNKFQALKKFTHHHNTA